MSKRIIIIAGPNGAGKTTFARSFLTEEAQLPRFINADLIAAGLSPFAPEAAAIKAGRLMLGEISVCAQRGESFAFETSDEAPNPLPTKAVLRVLGLPAGECRLPLGEAPAGLESAARSVLARLDAWRHQRSDAAPTRA
jgi:predicted component of type VI protein secretion system